MIKMCKILVYIYRSLYRLQERNRPEKIRENIYARKRKLRNSKLIRFTLIERFYNCFVFFLAKTDVFSIIDWIYSKNCCIHLEAQLICQLIAMIILFVSSFNN
jgi:hypothetical protein